MLDPKGVLVEDGLAGVAAVEGVELLEEKGFLNQLEDVLLPLDRQPARAAITTRTSAQRTDEIRMVKVSFETGPGAASRNRQQGVGPIGQRPPCLVKGALILEGHFED